MFETDADAYNAEGALDTVKAHFSPESHPDYDDYQQHKDQQNQDRNQEPGTNPSPMIYPSPNDPAPVAEQLIKDVFNSSGPGSPLAYWHGGWWLYRGTHWQEVEELLVRGPIYRQLGKKKYSKGIDKDGEEILVDWAPNKAKVGNILEPLAIESFIPGDSDAPTWLAHVAASPADRYVSMRNGLLNLETGHREPHTPDYFNTWSLPFSHDPEATCEIWEKFLGDVFAHDPQGQDLLQEMAGYFISGRKDLQKAMLLIGPKRSGKGTISRTLKQLVGAANTVSPSLHSIGSEFGLASLIGKPLAVLEDARAAGSGNGTAVEKLLNIIGEDAVSVNRKNKDYWNGTLPTRFLLVSNEMPRFLDSSGAIITRFISVKLSRSFEGMEDETLGSRINAEMPGIFNWAIAGLRRLEQQGKFTEPATHEDNMTLMGDLSSPVAKFLDEKYEVTGDAEDYITVSQVHTDHKLWCEDQELEKPNRDTFVQRLIAADPRIEMKNTEAGGKPKTRLFFGMKEKAW